MFELILWLALLLTGLVIGKAIELRHFRKLDEREAEFSDIVVTNLKTVPAQFENTQPFLVMGSAVIATDYFKVFVSGLRTLFGGEMKAYVTLMERARREAMLRMMQQAREQGATVVWNVRYETSTMGGQQKKKPGGVEVVAYGTALKGAETASAV